MKEVQEVEDELNHEAIHERSQRALSISISQNRVTTQRLPVYRISRSLLTGVSDLTMES